MSIQYVSCVWWVKSAVVVRAHTTCIFSQKKALSILMFRIFKIWPKNKYATIFNRNEIFCFAAFSLLPKIIISVQCAHYDRKKNIFNNNLISSYSFPLSQKRILDCEKMVKKLIKWKLAYLWITCGACEMGPLKYGWPSSIWIGITREPLLFDCIPWLVL